MTERKSEKRGLGRGLSALMADVAPERADTGGASGARRADTAIPIEKLFPNPHQPRRDFSEAGLEELSQSIREKGVIQPLIVRPLTGSDGFEIVAGERRWRAAQRAKLHEVPVIIRDYNDTEVLEVAIIENIQRADLNAVEEALAYRQLIDRFGHTQERVAEALGKSRSHVANSMRLLSLPEDVLSRLRTGELTAGHARALVTTEDPGGLARKIVARGLTVRQAERLAQDAKGVAAGKRPRSAGKLQEKDADTLALEADLAANLGMSVRITHEPGGETGILSIRYNTLDDLDLLCRALSSLPRDGSV